MGLLERGDLFVFPAETRRLPSPLWKGLQSADGMPVSHGPDLHLTDADQMEEYFKSYYVKRETDGKGVQPERARMNFANVAGRVRLIQDD
jgi:hypothetical protein